jgi:hypothetical protein
MTADQNTLVVIGDSDPTPINSAHVRKLMQFSKVAGLSLSWTLDRSIELFLRQEAPVYLAHAKQRPQA